MFWRIVGVLVVLLLSCSPAEVEWALVRETRDPRTHPLTVADALFSIPDVTGTMRLVGDLDGDGRGDLVAERGAMRGNVLRIDAVSSRDGRTIRTLWPARDSRIPRFPHPSWDAGGDSNGDGVPDLVFGQPTTDRSGRVTIVSGADGSTLRDMHAASSPEHWGWKVAFLGDLDGDGCSEYAIGSPDCDASGDNAGQHHPPSLCCHVSAYSGRNGKRLWRNAEDRPGRAFGARLKSAGDVDGDGHVDLLVGSATRSRVPLLVLSGTDGHLLGQLPDYGGPFGAAGDVDGDGRADVYLDRMHEHLDHHAGSTSIVSAGGASLFDLEFPDWASEHSITISTGDVDGDGVPDFLLGDANFHVRAPDDPRREDDAEPEDLRSMSLADALALESNPWCAMNWESGAAWVYSGRTRRVILGVWGAPGSDDGMGLGGATIPDLTGDGFPEIAICDATGAHVFAGPGPDPLHEPK